MNISKRTYDPKLIGTLATLKFVVLSELVPQKQMNQLFIHVVKCHKLPIEPEVIRTIRKSDQFQKYWTRFLDKLEIPIDDETFDIDKVNVHKIKRELIGSVAIINLMSVNNYISKVDAYTILIGVMQCHDLFPMTELVGKILKTKTYKRYLKKLNRIPIEKIDDDIFNQNIYDDVFIQNIYSKTLRRKKNKQLQIFNNTE